MIFHHLFNKIGEINMKLIKIGSFCRQTHIISQSWNKSHTNIDIQHCRLQYKYLQGSRNQHKHTSVFQYTKIVVKRKFVLKEKHLYFEAMIKQKAQNVHKMYWCWWIAQWQVTMTSHPKKSKKAHAYILSYSLNGVGPAV